MTKLTLIQIFTQIQSKQAFFIACFLPKYHDFTLKQVNFSVILHIPRIIIKDNFNKTDRLIQLMLCLLFLLLLQKRTYRLVIHTSSSG